jgi:hypothetical protein
MGEAPVQEIVQAGPYNVHLNLMFPTSHHFSSPVYMDLHHVCSDLAYPWYYIPLSCKTPHVNWYPPCVFRTTQSLIKYCIPPPPKKKPPRVYIYTVYMDIHLIVSSDHWPTYKDVWPGTPCRLAWLVAGCNTLVGGSFRGRIQIQKSKKLRILWIQIQIHNTGHNLGLFNSTNLRLI